MRALLVNPWIHDFSAYDLWSKPLGLLKIASSLKQLGFSIGLIDCLDRFHPRLGKFLRGKLPRITPYGSGNYYTQAIDKPEVFKSIPRIYKRHGLPRELFEELLGEEPRPDIILVTSGMSYWYGGVFEAIGSLKERFPGVPLILGGIYARLCPKHARENSGADFVYSGNSIPETLKLVGKFTGRDLDYEKIGNQEFFPAYELYPKLEFITMRTSSGCPFRCSYCGWYLLEKGFHQVVPDVIVERIEYFYTRRGIKNFAFYDEALLYNARGHVVKILRGLIGKKIKANFHTPSGLHIRYVTSGVAGLMKDCGFVQPRLGLETTSRRRQVETGAKTTNEEFLEAVRFFREAGFASREIGVNILMGLPNQDLREVKESIKFCAREGVRIFLEEYSPIPGTGEYSKSGLPPDADPLLHNNSAFPLYRLDDYRKFQELKDLVHELNKRLADE